MKLLSFIMVLLSAGTKAQEMIGINGSNYCGTAGSHINPSSLSNFPLKWEAHLLTLDVFLENNYAYMPKTSVIKELKKIKKEGADYQESDFVFSKNQLKNKSAYLNLMVKVPSVLFKIKHHRIALINNGIRTVMSANKINFTMPKINPQLVAGDSIILDFDDLTFAVPKFRINAMAWSEFGISYATTIAMEKGRKLNVGFTLKRLHGYMAGYLLNNGVFFDLTDPLNSLAKIDVEYGFINPENAGPGYSGLVSGKGIGVDIGATIVFKKKYKYGGIKMVEDMSNSPLNYGLRAGVSLIDAGRIYFDQNVQKFRVDKFIINDSITDLDVLVNNELYNFPQQSQPGADFYMRLPTALSLQIDYKFRKNLFINGTLVQRIVLKGPGIDRANQLSFTPRYETRWVGFSLPMSLYQYKYTHLGAALRLGPLWVGSDKIGSIFFPGKFSGTDIYLSLRIMPVNLKRQKRGHGQSAKTPGDLPCSFLPYKSDQWIISLIEKLKKRVNTWGFRSN